MIENELREASDAAVWLRQAPTESIDKMLRSLADALDAATLEILAANAADLAAIDAANPMRDRLALSEERLRAMADGIRAVADLPSPLGRTLSDTVRPNGMHIRRVSVPFGVIGVVYEARPNVTTDVFALCVKAGSACILKGGREAAATNAALVALVRSTLAAAGFPAGACTYLSGGHDDVGLLLNAVGRVDLVIPRGGKRLIEFVRDNARVPVIETGAGVCHTYFDRAADLAKGAAIVANGKMRRVSVCNALDCLLVHGDRLADLAALVAPMAERVTLLADEAAYAALDGHYPAERLQHATEEHYGMEMLSYRLAVKVVADMNEALAHIARYSSRHSEAIISDDLAALDRFTRMVDAACVYTNLPTSWTDGGEFGLGAEIGISTQKLHARGPMGLAEITTYKYVITGDGQTRK